MQASRADVQLAAEQSVTIERAVLEAVQTRWAKLLGAMWGTGLEAYARGADTEPPVSRRTFCAALELSEELLRACTAAAQPAGALWPTLQSLGGNLLTVRWPTLAPHVLLSYLLPTLACRLAVGLVPRSLAL